MAAAVAGTTDVVAVVADGMAAAAAAAAAVVVVAVAAVAEAVVAVVAAAAAEAAVAVVDVAAVAETDRSDIVMTKLEKASHISVIAVCCLAAGLLIEQRFFSSPETEQDPARELVGREVRLPGADWQAAPVSVLLQISSTCDFCNESMPFYKQLMAVREAQASKVPVIVVSRDAVAVMRKHLEGQQVNVDKVLHSRMDSLGTLTPTIYVVDSKGVVKRAFVGELDSTGEKELLSIVEHGKV